MSGWLSPQELQLYEDAENALRDLAQARSKLLQDSGITAERAKMMGVEPESPPRTLSLPYKSFPKQHRPYLRGAHLPGGLLLAKLRLRRSDLCGADIRHSDCRETDLSHSNLQNIILEDVNLTGADLSFSDLRGAYFDATTRVKDALFEEAKLPLVAFSKADGAREADLDRRTTTFWFKGPKVQVVDFVFGEDDKTAPVDTVGHQGSRCNEIEAYQVLNDIYGRTAEPAERRWKDTIELSFRRFSKTPIPKAVSIASIFNYLGDWLTVEGVSLEKMEGLEAARYIFMQGENKAERLTAHLLSRGFDQEDLDLICMPLSGKTIFRPGWP